MAASDAPATLAELQTDFLEGLKEATGVTAITTLATRYLNRALQDFYRERWPWAERRTTLTTHPGYSDGTVSIALATRTTVTGASTLWNTAVTGYSFKNVNAGGKLTFAGASDPYVVSAVGGDTALTLQDNYVGTAALSGATYQYYEDEYALASDFDDVIDARYFTDDRTIPLIGPQEFYRRYARNTVRQAPKVATLIQLGPSGSVALRPRVLLGPAPDRTYILPYRYYTTNLAISSTGVGAANLSAATDQPITPLKYRAAHVYRALQFWTGERKGFEAATAYFKGLAEEVVLRARQSRGPADDRPSLRPIMAPYIQAARSPYALRGARRSSGGTRWDQLEE
jgi:hypothetical protein